MTLPGILPPDAGRLERAARRYAIALLSDMHARPSSAVRESAQALSEVEERQHGSPPGPMEAVSHSIRGAIEDAESWRHLRVRVTLYLRWCERVEREGREPGWAREWAAPGDPRAWEGYWGPVRWAVPLWTLAPAHDPAVTAAERRRKRA